MISPNDYDNMLADNKTARENAHTKYIDDMVKEIDKQFNYGYKQKDGGIAVRMFNIGISIKNSKEIIELYKNSGWNDVIFEDFTENERIPDGYFTFYR